MVTKKYYFFLLCVLCLFPLSIQAQHHMEFMGIPLTGSITEFQSELLAKGAIYNETMSQKLPIGVRLFTGVFADEDVAIYVYYNPTSKVVYEAKVMMVYSTKNSCEIKYNEMKGVLSSTYSDVDANIDFLEGHECCYFILLNEGDPDDPLGTIQLSVQAIGPYYSVHISFLDSINSIKS